MQVTAQLTRDQLWFLERLYRTGGYDRAHDITSTVRNMSSEYSFSDADDCIRELAKRRVLSISPDGWSFKLTDLGFEALNHRRQLQQEWEQPGIVRVLDPATKELVVPAGNTFTGQRALKLILREATKSTDIIDPYIGSDLFDRLEDAEVAVAVRILTSENSKSSESYFRAFRQTYKSVELRVVKSKLHDRFIIIDGVKAYQFGHSLKDLGKKDTRFAKVSDVNSVRLLFDQRWSEGTPVA